MPNGYLVTLGDGSLDTNDFIDATQIFFNVAATLGAGGWNWSGVWDGNGSFYSNINDTGTYYEGTDGNVYFVPDTWYTTSGTAYVTSAPAYTAANGIVDGTTGDDVIDTSFTDGDGEQIDAGDGTGPLGHEDTVSAGAGDDSVRSGLEDDLIYGGGGSDTLWGEAGNDTIYGDTDPNAASATPVSITSANFTDTASGFTVTAQNVVGGVLTASSGGNVTDGGGWFGASGTISDSDSGVQQQIGYDLASGQSETLTVDFDNPIDALSFTTFSLRTSDFAEVGHYALYLGGVLVYETDFTDTTGTGTMTVSVSGHGDFDQIVFTALPQTDGTDGSDYGITDLTFTPTLDGNAPDADDIRGGDGNDLIFGEGGDDTLRGNQGADTISGGTGNDSILAGGGADEVDGGAGNDTINGGNGADTITGGLGEDSISGGAGNDLIGDAPVSDSAVLDWASASANGTFALAGATETVNVTIATTTNVSGQTVSAFSSGTPAADALWASGISDPITTTMDFDAELSNLTFEIYDIDQNTGSWDDKLTIIALDADGNQVPVTFSDLDGLHSVNGDTLDADGNASTGVETTGAADSVSVSIAGPVTQLIFIFDNGESATNSGLFGVSNLSFDFTVEADSEPGNDTMLGDAGNDSIYAGSGDDSIAGGTGSDLLYGQDGDDTFEVAEGDSAYGGDGDDYFTLVELNETAGAGNAIYIEGGEGAETTGDVLNLSTLGNRNDIVYTNTDDANGGLSGTLTLADGTLLTFENIEKIICFTPGTMIDTPEGPRAIDALRVGDLVNTLHEGAQPIRWIGTRTLPCTPGTAPVRFERGAIDGLTAPLTVSPQHKMLVEHYAADLLFDAPQVLCTAKHMHGPGISRAPMRMVTYIHLMLDRHQIITANGVRTESFHAGPEGLKALSEQSRADLFRSFPQLENDPYAHGKAALPCLRAQETELLMCEIAMARDWAASQMVA